MTLSLWRYSHLVLAISSGLFILFAALTGIILSFEPIKNKTQPYYIAGGENAKLHVLIGKLKTQYEEIYSLKRDKNHHIILETDAGSFYINPFTGKKIGTPAPRKQIFTTVEGLHRSLFLKTPGRIVVGFSAFLLLLIVVSGIALILKRQQGLIGFFKKVTKDHTSQYLHTVFGRWMLIPLLILSLTGTYLFLQRYKIIPHEKTILSPINNDSKITTPLEIAAIPIFQTTAIKDIREIIFPFEVASSEYYHIKFKDKEIYVDQFSGAVAGEILYPFSTVMRELSLTLHTGRGNVIWAIILGVSCLSIPYFIYSGFVITFTRRKGRIKNKHKKNESQYIILVGSEGGSTFGFAAMLQKALIKQGRTCCTAELNDYAVFKKMQYLIVMTATYGQGEAPSNAKQFKKLLHTHQNKPFAYTVVGFGSLSYPDFCKFAFDTQNVLEQNTGQKPLLEPHTIHNKSFESFSKWANNFSKKINLPLKLPKEKKSISTKKIKKFEILQKTSAHENVDETFLVTLKKNKQKIQSGDLLAVFPEREKTERLYSIALYKNNILLSIKRHVKGICSNYLNDLSVGEFLCGYVLKNKSFHLPKGSKKIILIATGTGIAPFLGMLDNEHKKEIALYWGGKTKESFDLYKPFIKKALEQNKLQKFFPAYSRCKNKTYVQDLILRDKKMVAATLKENGSLMICGSIAMQEGIFKVLEKITSEINKKPLNFYQKNNQIRVDCY